VQFGLMGAAYAQIRLSRSTPSVGLLSNGTEPGKGTELLREADQMLRDTSLNYAGFIEGRDLPLGAYDVVVTDGFTGNVVLKVSEGIALALLDRVREGLKGNLLGALGGLLVRRALRSLRSELDWVRIGGAPLLGVDGVVVAAHGSSDAEAVASGIRVTRELADLGLVERLRAALSAADVPQAGTNSLPGALPDR
jgi:glycerol-3-phosphate acyltransferase PlsX